MPFDEVDYVLQFKERLKEVEMIMQIKRPKALETEQWQAITNYCPCLVFFDESILKWNFCA